MIYLIKAMIIIIMRHGQAAFCGADRELTAEGVEEVKKTARNLCAHYSIKAILCSPKTRALQTANAVKDALVRNKNAEIEVLSDLTPSGEPHLCFDYVNAKFAGNSNDAIVLISHIPLVQKMVEYACPKAEIPLFVTGSAFIMEEVDGRFRAKAFFTPSSEFFLD